jgi:hypothetical protein
MAATASGIREATRRGRRNIFGHGIAMLAAALMMSWTAIYNGFPLLYPDSMTYLEDGRLVARALFLHKFSPYYGMRSLIYSLGILPWHWNINPWPIVALQSLITAYILWLAVRSVLPKDTTAYYLSLVLILSISTSLSWYVPIVLPDFLGPVLYLSIYLLVFAGDTLFPGERASLYVIGWWAVTSHASHLILGAALCIFLLILFLIRPRMLRLKSVGEVAVILLIAAASQFALNSYLNGKPSLNGERPPFLTARVIADGPGRWYLDRHCGEVKWVICDHLKNASSDPDNFLWGSDGVWQNLSDEEGERMIHEEMPFVLATIRAYPLQQLSKSAANFGGQLVTFGYDDLDPSGWVLDEFNSVLPSQRSRYLKSRQARDAMPLDFFTSLQNWTVVVSLAVIAVSVPLLWRRGPAQIHGLSLVIAFAVVANALVTGTISMVEDRLQCRVVWLVPLLAGMLMFTWVSRYRESKARAVDGNSHLPGEHTQAAKPLAV